MSLRLLYWAPLALLVAAVGLWALRAGFMTARLTETDVIDHYATLYVDQSGIAGAARTDCHAVPGQVRGVWIMLLCARPAAQENERITYLIDRRGGLVDLPEPAQDGRDKS